MLAGDKVDYRSDRQPDLGARGAARPDPAREDSRYQQPSGSVSAATFQAAAPAAAQRAPATTDVAPQAVGDVQHRARSATSAGSAATLPPEQLCPQVRTFWKDSGFTLVQDRADAGVMETDWAENRAKLPQDFIRSTIGKVVRPRVLDRRARQVPHPHRAHARPAARSTSRHRGMVEVYIGQRKDSTIWQPRPADPQLEAEFLSRLMVKLGAKEESREGDRRVPHRRADRRRRAPASSTASRPPTLQVDDGFDRAWRRVGMALDRSGFTVEDRDRAPGHLLRALRRPGVRRQGGAGLLQPSCSASAQEGRRRRRWRKYRVKVKAEGDDEHGVGARCARARPRTAKPASGSSACSSKTCEVAAAARATHDLGDAGHDPLLQPRQRQQRQRHGRRGEQRRSRRRACSSTAASRCASSRRASRAPGSSRGDLDAVFVTHEHGDHIGCALALARRHGCRCG